jgi:NADH dehydrogenase
MAERPKASNNRVVIIGAGFAGIEVARALGAAGIAATLIDRRNYHLFQPLLYQVATAALSPADIAEPIRKMLRRYRSVEVVLGEVTGIDTAARTVTLAGGEVFSYEVLVVATGATHGYFGHDEWAHGAPGLKTVEDARTIRSRLLLAFEKAEIERDPEEQRRLMTIAVIGGGPTGVELAGSIAELAHFTLAKDFHRIRAQDADVILFEAGDRILAAFPEGLARYAAQRLEKLGVKIRLRSPVQNVTPHGIVVAGTEIGVGAPICRCRGAKASLCWAISHCSQEKTASRFRVSHKSQNRKASISGARW